MTIAEATTVIVTDDAPAAAAGPIPWRGVLVIANQSTGWRIMRNVTWRELPLPLKWQREDQPGHDASITVGTIDEIEADGDLIRATGLLLPDVAEVAEVEALIRAGALRGVSVDPGDDGGADVISHEDGTLEFVNYEIGAATLVAVPAFRGAWIALDGMPDPVDSEDAQDDQTPTGEVVITAALTIPADAPDPAVFTDPGLDRRRGLHVETDGRVWGHIYGWGECHLGSPPGRCVQVPHGVTEGGYYAGQDGRGVLCADGTLAPTGPLVIGADHAALHLPWLAAKDHYANAGLAAADVVCGEDAHGIWIAGRIRPGVSQEHVYALRASAPSVDCRSIAGRLRLICTLAVNMPGFPALAAHIDGAQVMALVASGGPTEPGACSCGSASVEDVVARRLDPVLAELRTLTAPLRRDAAAALEADVLPPGWAAPRLAALDAEVLGG